MTEKELMKLPKGWFWSYVFSPEADPKKQSWSACAVKDLGKEREGRPPFSPIRLYNEVFREGKTKEEAVEKVKDAIRTLKHHRRRWIHFPDWEDQGV